MIYILCGALFFIPLCGSIVLDPFFSIRDIFAVKEFLSLLSIILIVACPMNQTARIMHRPISALMVFLVIASFSIPPINLEYGHENLAGLWVWRGLAWAFAYFMLYQRLVSVPFVRDHHQLLFLRAVGWSAILSSLYAFIQWAGLDQWQVTRSVNEIGQPQAPGITAMMINPTYMGIWLAICLPFVITYSRKIWIAVVFGAILLSHSDIAIGGAILSMVLLGVLRAKNDVCLKALSGAIVFALIVSWAFWSDIQPFFNQRANGRLGVWQQTWEDWRAPCVKLPVSEEMSEAQKKEIKDLNKRTYALTGRGLGSFPFIFGVKYSSKFESAHNEYLESLYSIGLIGALFVFGIIGWVLKKSYAKARSDPWTRAIFVSFLFCCAASVGAPLWHIEPLRFYTVVLFALLAH